MEHTILRPKCREICPRLASGGPTIARAGGGPAGPGARKTHLHSEAGPEHSRNSVPHVTLLGDAGGGEESERQSDEPSKSAKVIMPAPKEIVTMRLDADLLRWFRRQRG